MSHPTSINIYECFWHHFHTIWWWFQLWDRDAIYQKIFPKYHHLIHLIDYIFWASLPIILLKCEHSSIRHKCDLNTLGQLNWIHFFSVSFIYHNISTDGKLIYMKLLADTNKKFKNEEKCDIELKICLVYLRVIYQKNVCVNSAKYWGFSSYYNAWLCVCVCFGYEWMRHQ